jgi:hypothetical protein
MTINERQLPLQVGTQIAGEEYPLKPNSRQQLSSGGLTQVRDVDRYLPTWGRGA